MSISGPYGSPKHRTVGGGSVLASRPEIAQPALVSSDLSTRKIAPNFAEVPEIDRKSANCRRGKRFRSLNDKMPKRPGIYRFWVSKRARKNANAPLYLAIFGQKRRNQAKWPHPGMGPGPSPKTAPAEDAVKDNGPVWARGWASVNVRGHARRTAATKRRVMEFRACPKP